MPREDGEQRTEQMLWCITAVLFWSQGACGLRTSEDCGVVSVYLMIRGGILKLLEKQKCSSDACICLRAETSHLVTQCVGTALGSSAIHRMQVWNNICP